MKPKKTLSLACLIGGIASILFATYGMGRVGRAKKVINTITEPLSDNAYGSLASGALKNKAGEYDGLLRAFMVGGIALTVIGAGLYFFKKK